MNNGWKKQIVQWRENDRLHISVVFTWYLPMVKRLCEMWLEAGAHPVVGGPAVRLMPDYLKDVAEIGTDIDALRLHNPMATFTSRGCIRSCDFCAVPKIEGQFRELATWEAKPIVCDNNLLASSQAHFDKVIDSLKHLKGVDFNQGLDCRLLNGHHIDRLKELKVPTLRFAWDYTPMESVVMSTIERLLKAGFPKSRIQVYVLFGYKDTPEDALYRFETLKTKGIRPNPARYQSLDSLRFDEYIDIRWTRYDLHKMRRYWYRQNWCSKVPYAEFIG